MSYAYKDFGIGFLLSSRERRYERNPRKGTKQPEFLLHRFPIKEGCTFSDVLAHQMRKSNALLARLLENKLYS